MIYIAVPKVLLKMVRSIVSGKQAYMKPTQGFTFLGLLVIITIAGIGMAAVGMVWSKASQREREQDLIYIGHAYQRAIGSYFQVHKQFPRKLADLLQDETKGNVKRHLRRLYPDPITRGEPWGLMKKQGQIIGVYSTSEKKPIKQAGFKYGLDGFANAKTYQDWKFLFIAPVESNPSTPNPAKRNT